MPTFYLKRIPPTQGRADNIIINKMKIHKFKETIEYNFDGFTCYIKIDYMNNRFDIVKPKGSPTSGNFEKKDFTFIGRGVEYMDGWIKILSHLQEAIKDAKKKYEANLAEESKFADETIAKLLKTKKL
jgi:hypothetical protein